MTPSSVSVFALALAAGKAIARTRMHVRAGLRLVEAPNDAPDKRAESNPSACNRAVVETARADMTGSPVMVSEATDRPIVFCDRVAPCIPRDAEPASISYSPAHQTDRSVDPHLHMSAAKTDPDGFGCPGLFSDVRG